MDDKILEVFKEKLKSKDTRELLSMRRAGGREIYTGEALKAAEMLLEERGIRVSEDAGHEKHLRKAYAVYNEGENYKKALEEVDAAIELRGEIADAHNLRGALLCALGRPVESVKAYERALEIEPGFKEAAENLSSLKSALSSGGGLVTVAEFSLPSEAYVFRTELDSEGIWSFLTDEETLTAAPHFSIAIGGVKLKVRAEDAGRAVEVLKRGG